MPAELGAVAFWVSMLLSVVGAASVAGPAWAGDLALNRPASASSTDRDLAQFAPARANDGSSDTRWASSFTDNQWWSVDLGGDRTVNRVELNWDNEYPSTYRLQSRASTTKKWATVATINLTSPGLKTHTFKDRLLRYFRVISVKSATPWGISLRDARVCDNNTCDGSSPTPTPGTSANYRVSGRNLYDPCGETLVVRGVEQMFWNTSWLSNGFVDEIGKTGANTVRVLPQISAPTPDGGQPATLADAEDLIKRGIADHMLVDVALDGGKNPDIYLRSDVKALLFKYQRNIVIHAVGESSESTDAAWATRVEGVIEQLRAAGYMAPLYVMSRDGGRNLPTILNKGAEILASDPLHNVVFGWQAYWGASNYYQNRYGMTLTQAMARVRDAAFPIQVGLLKTTDPGETMNYSAVMADAQAYGIGWLWWDWRMSTDDLTTNGIYGSWTPEGQDVVLSNPNGIARTSTRTYYQRYNACPTP